MSRQPLTDAQAEAGFRPAPFTDAEWQAMADDPMNVGDIGERLAWLEARVSIHDIVRECVTVTPISESDIIRFCVDQMRRETVTPADIRAALGEMQGVVSSRYPGSDARWWAVRVAA